MTIHCSSRSDAQSLPEDNPSLYTSMALALTFPFNIIIGISIYLAIINRIWI